MLEELTDKKLRASSALTDRSPFRLYSQKLDSDDFRVVFRRQRREREDLEGRVFCPSDQNRAC